MEADPPDDEPEWYGDPDEDEVPLKQPRRKKSQGRRAAKKSSNAVRSLFLIGGAVFLGVLLIGVLATMLPRLWNQVSQQIADRQKTAAEAGDTQNVSTAASINTGAPISDDECRAFARSLEQAVATSDAAAIQRLLNFNAILDKSLDGIDLPENTQAEFRRGAMSSAPSFANQVLSQAKTGSYSYLRTMEADNGGRQVLLRLKAEAGLNYHRFDLIRNQAQQVVSGDVYFFSSGEYVSTTMKRLLLPLVASANRSIIDRMTGADSALMKNLPKFQQLQQAQKMGQHSRVVQLYKSLPEELRVEKYMLLIRTMSAAKVNDGEYVASMEDFKRYFPNDACLDLLLIDYYLLKKRMPECHAAIDRLDAAVGGDPFLQILHGAMFLEEGRLAEARSAMAPILTDETLASDAHVAILDVHVAAQDHKATAETLLILEERYGHNFDQILVVPQFAQFIASSEYRAWNSKRGSGTKGRSMTNTPRTSKPQTNQPSTANSTMSSNKSNKTNSGKKPSQIFTKFKHAILRKDANAAAEFVAPIAGAEKFIASLKEIAADRKLHHPFLMMHFRQTREEGEVAVALSPFRRFKSKPPGTYDQVYFVRIGDDWKIAPTFDQPPTDAQYQASVKTLQGWLAQQ